MSFFRNLRSSITRGRSSSRDTTPVRNSRPGSVISSLNSGSGKRRDSIESRSDSLFNRSETFILDEPDVTPCHSNCSTLEKKSKKSKVLEKFSTFTKRKKTPATETAAFEHHPSDNATNTYYKWQADGVNSLDYDSQNDPFNFLYEQQSSLKSLHNNSSSSQADSLKSSSTPTTTTFDSSTFRKGKMPNDLKKQLKLLKDQDHLSNKENDSKKVKEPQPLALREQEDEEEEDGLKSDKYKTVTLNSFRKSFREKFLQQQKDAAHNPAWFVQVENPELNKNKLQPRGTSKENRRDLLVFENDNYRPGSRSPIRDLNNRKAVRSPTRSPVKRNETFKVERLSRFDKQALKAKPEDYAPSIRIEFKNSITPHIPGRMVPVGVAKPMPSQLTNTHYYQKTENTPMNTSYTVKSSVGNTTTTRLNNHSPIRSPWLKEQSPCRNTTNSTNRTGRYQTLVQIKNDKTRQSSPVRANNSRLSTRIQLGTNGPTNPERKTNLRSVSPSFGKRYNTSHLLSNGVAKAQPLKQTYFGDSPQTAKIIQTTPSSQLSSATSGLRTTRIVGTPGYGNYKYQHTTPSSSLFSSATTLTPSSISTSSSRSTPSHSVNNIHSSSHNNLSYLKHYQLQQTPPQQRRQQQQQQHQHQSRIMVAGQRRSRSPIKIPWR